MGIDKKRIPKELDQRRKLTEEMREDIRDRHKRGEATRQIAREYKDICSRRAIQYTIKPELYEKLKKDFKERRADGRYKPTTKESRERMRKHRAYKRSILKKLL